MAFVAVRILAFTVVVVGVVGDGVVVVVVDDDDIVAAGVEFELVEVLVAQVDELLEEEFAFAINMRFELEEIMLLELEEEVELALVVVVVVSGCRGRFKKQMGAFSHQQIF